MDRGHLDEEPDRKFGRSASGGQVRDQIARDQGVINLRRLSSKDVALVSPRLGLPPGTTPEGKGVLSRLGSGSSPQSSSAKRGREDGGADAAVSLRTEMPPPPVESDAAEKEEGEEEGEQDQGPAKRRRRGSVAVIAPPADAPADDAADGDMEKEDGEH